MAWTYLWLLGVVLGAAEGRRAPPEGNCVFSRVYKMLAADCSAINLVEIPKAIAAKKPEALDATVNRIRYLRSTSFVGFDYLRFLYLGDNSIHTIEEEAFEPLIVLEVLDLSMNAIRDLPELLPDTLRRLYLNKNPIRAVPLQRAESLRFLTLAECDLTTLPEMGKLPLLQELNISGNPLQTLSVFTLASFCNLQTLILPNSLLEKNFVNSCDCMRMSMWTTQHSIYTHPAVNCTILDEVDCQGNSTDEEEVFASCQKAYQEQTATHWTVLAVSSCFVVLCVVTLTILWRRRWRKKPPPKHPTALATNATTVEQNAPGSKKLLRDSQTKPRF